MMIADRGYNVDQGQASTCMGVDSTVGPRMQASGASTYLDHFRLPDHSLNTYQGIVGLVEGQELSNLLLVRPDLQQFLVALYFYAAQTQLHLNVTLCDGETTEHGYRRVKGKGLFSRIVMLSLVLPN